MQNYFRSFCRWRAKDWEWNLKLTARINLMSDEVVLRAIMKKKQIYYSFSSQIWHLWIPLKLIGGFLYLCLSALHRPLWTPYPLWQEDDRNILFLFSNLPKLYSSNSYHIMFHHLSMYISFLPINLRLSSFTNFLKPCTK